MRRRRASLEERMAWDQYACAFANVLGHTHASRNDGEKDPVTAAQYADDMLKERRKRFGRKKMKPKRSLARLH